jgi:tryptophan synthase alpha chain
LSEISRTFKELKSHGEGALIAYLTVGDPHPKKTSRLAGALIEGGADIIELGIAFSDPIADGPTIQNAVSRSLASGTKPTDAFEIAQHIREKHDAPLALMTYYNPIFKAGIPGFVARARESGFSGLIVPDLPVEESMDYKAVCNKTEMDTIFLASPSTDYSRFKEIVSHTSGYLYLVSLFGVTGTRRTLSNSALKLVSECKDRLDGVVPLAAGFGISNPDHVKRIIAAGADGAIVGSAFVKIVGENAGSMTRATRKLTSLAKAMKKAARLKATR